MDFSIPVWRYPITGLMETTFSPSSSITRRSTPWVEGCCGPMLIVMVLNSGVVAMAIESGAGAARFGRRRRLAHGSRIRPLQGCAVDLLLELHDSVDQRFGARRAPGNVHVHRDHRVHALDDRVVVEDSPARGAGAHGDHPFRLGHLVVDSLQHR